MSRDIHELLDLQQPSIDEQMAAAETPEQLSLLGVAVRFFGERSAANSIYRESGKRMIALDGQSDAGKRYRAIYDQTGGWLTANLQTLSLEELEEALDQAIGLDEGQTVRQIQTEADQRFDNSIEHMHLAGQIESRCDGYFARRNIVDLRQLT